MRLVPVALIGLLRPDCSYSGAFAYPGLQINIFSILLCGF